MTERPLYPPRRLASPKNGYYTGTLGHFEFEELATRIVKLSRSYGSWQPVHFDRRDLSHMTDAREMMRAGLLRRTKKGDFFLTNLTLEKLAEKYSKN